jgi:hypothetical protein
VSPSKKSFNTRIAEEGKNERNHVCGRTMHSDNTGSAILSCLHRRTAESAYRMKTALLFSYIIVICPRPKV